MTATIEMLQRLPSTTLTKGRTQPREKAGVRAAHLLASAAWTVQAGLLAFLAVYLLSDAATSLLTVIGAGLAGTAAVWQVVLSVAALVVPFAAGAGIAMLVRNDGGSVPLAAAGLAGTVLATGLAEMGGLALIFLFFGG